MQAFQRPRSPVPRPKAGDPMGGRVLQDFLIKSGDGTRERIAETSGEYVERWRIARCGGDGNRTRAFRLRATPFLLAEKKWGKETASGNLFRGGSLWTPSPTTKGAPPPLDPPLLDERRETRVYGGRNSRVLLSHLHRVFEGGMLPCLRLSLWKKQIAF